MNTNPQIVIPSRTLKFFRDLVKGRPKEERKRRTTRELGMAYSDETSSAPRQLSLGEREDLLGIEPDGIERAKIQRRVRAI